MDINIPELVSQNAKHPSASKHADVFTHEIRLMFQIVYGPKLIHIYKFNTIKTAIL